MCKRNLSISLIFVIVQNSFKIVTADWVEIPQFSDVAKVYKVPFTNYDHGEKYFLESQDGPKIQSFPNTSAANEGLRRIRIHQQSSIDKSPKPSLSSVTFPPTSVTMKSVNKIKTIEGSVTQRPQKIDHFFEDIIYEKETTTVEVKDEEVSVPTTSSIDEIVVDKDEPYQFVSSATHPQEADKAEEEDDSKTTFLAYMPLELFKKVHATLKSQPSTIKGKLGFLKRFEITLLAEIEKQLVPVVSPVRRKRDSHGDHGWDDNDDHVGFPSLEGALMAISFLTFAVYLVQLVMMLFRNLGNSTNPPGTAAVLLNRNKRSVEELTEDTARVFDYLDKFAKYQSTGY